MTWKTILGVGLLLMAAVCCYPPVVTYVPNVPESRSSLGREPIWEQPPHNSSRQIDWHRLAAELAVVGLATGGFAVLAAGRRLPQPAEQHVHQQGARA